MMVVASDALASMFQPVRHRVIADGAEELQTKAVNRHEQAAESQTVAGGEREAL